MKNKALLILIGISFLLFLPARAQTAMGKWNIHLAFNSVSKITQSPNKIYALSDGTLFSVDKSDGNIDVYSKLTGLNGSVVAQVEYDEANNQLLICYTNGNIDLMTSNGIVNVPDFYNKIMNVSKNINHIEIYNNKAYLSCSFGIIVLNLKRHEIADTYYIGPNASEVNVINTTVHNGNIYALTSVDITSTTKQYRVFRASLSNSNLVNYENWHLVQDLPGSGDKLQNILSFAGSLFVQSDDLLYKQNSNGTWEKVINEQVAYANASNGKLFVGNNNFNSYVLSENLAANKISTVKDVRGGEYDKVNNIYWLAGSFDGVVAYNLAQNSIINRYIPDGPVVNTPWDMVFSGEKLFVVPGGKDIEGFGRMGYVMIYENGHWYNIYGDIIIEQTGGKPTLDFVNIAVDPDDNTHFFVTSYGTGLYEFKNNQFFKKYDHSNSPIETIVATDADKYMRLDGAVFDKSGNLFFNNIYADKGPVKIISKSGDWSYLPYPQSDGKFPTLGKIFISEQNPNQKWVLSVRSKPGIGIFDDAGTLDNTKDDKSIFYSSFTDPDNTNQKIAPNNYFSIAQDKNGVIWVGTDKGPLLFYNTSRVFDSGYTCSRVKISRNDGSGLADLLLAEESIKAITIDGANRKWLGTASSGVYLMSENGQETIHHFTTSNSPLLSDEIFSIAINPISGEVFFATGNGIISYQGDAAEGEDNFDNAHAYPNPVRENYTGVITLAGLIEGTQVKITDLNGNLICETTSNGSIATWNARDASGRKVNTGVYLALCVSEDGKQSTVIKILVIN